MDETFEILDGDGVVINVIVADAAFVEAVHPGRYRLKAAPMQEAALTPRVITRLAFRNRFTAHEKAAIELAAVHSPDASTEQQQRAAALRAYLKDLDAASFIDLDSEYIAQACQMLETAGLLATGRAEQITGAPVQPEELP